MLSICSKYNPSCCRFSSVSTPKKHDFGEKTQRKWKKSGLDEFSVTLDTHENPGSKTQRDHRRSAITHEWQWDTHDRQNAADHAHIDERIHEKHHGNGASQQTRKKG